MESKGTIIGIVGSPNRDGRTNQLVAAALQGAAQAGAMYRTDSNGRQRSVGLQGLPSLGLRSGKEVQL